MYQVIWSWTVCEFLHVPAAEGTVMPSIKVQAYFGCVLVCLSFSPTVAPAQVGAVHHYHCHVLRMSTKTVYSSSIVVSDVARGAMMQAWHQYMLSAYDLTPTPAAPDRYDCVDLGASPDQQQAALSYTEKSWTASSYRIVHVDYPPGAGAAPGSSAPVASSHDPLLIDPSSFPTVRAFMSCSTAGTGGANIYYTGVFAADLKTGNRGRGGRSALIIDRKVVDPASVQEVLDHFQAYLTHQGYKYVPGNSSACDVRPTEAEAKAAEHYRAYEGGGCTSGCGKIIETGWKQE
jgi:hypothetical protein